uniref:Putative NAD-binding protein n=1 Tax=Moniliophthora roreri TaxID=221103 RepID=A0A0W0G8E1_MONRR
MSSKTTVLITGATGNLLSHLLKRQDASSFEFRALVRSSDKAEKLKAFGVVPVLGSHSDKELMISAASEVDVVIAMADSDDLEAAEATLAGLKKHYEKTGKRSILIHTSGIANIGDNTDGNQTSDNIYADDDVEKIDRIPATNLHRHVDVRIAAADDEGYVRTYIVIPSAVYTPAQNVFVDAGISNPAVSIFNSLVPIAIQRGQGFTIGAGVNVCPCVHIDELVDIYERLLNSVLKDADKTPHGRAGYHFAASDEFRMGDVYEGIAKALFELGKAKSPELTQLTKEERERYLGPYATAFSSNQRCRSNNARKLGWKPTKTTKDFLATIRGEVKYRLKNVV